MKKFTLLLLTLAFLFSACSPLLGADCPTTSPSNLAFIPPEPCPSQAPYDSMFWHGNEKLWTMLPTNGVWRDLPFGEEGYVQKTFWWAPNIAITDESSSDFAISIKRLDAIQDQITRTDATNAYSGEIGSAILVGVSFPTEGCWQITGKYRAEKISFTILVAP